MNEQLRILLNTYVAERTGQIIIDAMEENADFSSTMDSLDSLAESLGDMLSSEAQSIFEQFVEQRNYEQAIVEGIVYLQGLVDGICIYNNAKKL